MVLTGLGRMQMIDAPKPELKADNDVLIRVTNVGVCGSDIHYYTQGKIGSQVVEFPFAVGHETAGVVESVGAAVTRVKPGDRIAIDPAVSCWSCDQCLAGRPHTCRKLKFLGCPGQLEGSLTEYIVMPERSCYLLDDELTLDEGVLSEPLAIGVYAVNQSVALAGKTIGVFGFGPIGMSVMLAAKAKGGEKFFVSDLVKERINTAAKMGASWTGAGDDPSMNTSIKEQEPSLLDVIFECCGKQEAIDQAVELLKPGGKLMIIGIPEFSRWSFDVDQLRRKEITICNVRRQNECVDETLKLMRTGAIDAKPMITHRFPFEQTQAAFDLVKNYQDGVMKAMIDF